MSAAEIGFCIETGAIIIIFGQYMVRHQDKSIKDVILSWFK